MNSNILKEYCEKNLNLDLVRICEVDYYEDLKKYLTKRYDENHITGMEEMDIEKRVNPKLIMENAKSIIVIAFPYYIGEFENSNLSKYCLGEDYHLVTKKLMQNICDYLSENIELNCDGEKFESKYFADTGVLNERYLATISGIGYVGINNNIITDKYGSYVFLGYIVNNFEFEKDEPLNKTCCKCLKCVQSCPPNALLGNFEMNPKKCLSYLTQTKDELSEKEKSLIKENKNVFGCDICQDVCPHNRNIEKSNISNFYDNIIEVLDIDEIRNMTNKEFKKEFREKAFNWRGKKIILRNLEIINEERK
ncbi:MAG: tRNA epoxyqueuosine(34) reductase QueG [Peptostreptococcaceae bacterium]